MKIQWSVNKFQGSLSTILLQRVFSYILILYVTIIFQRFIYYFLFISRRANESFHQWKFWSALQGAPKSLRGNFRSNFRQNQQRRVQSGANEKNVPANVNPNNFFTSLSGFQEQRGVFHEEYEKGVVRGCAKNLYIQYV